MPTTQTKAIIFLLLMPPLSFYSEKWNGYWTKEKFMKCICKRSLEKMHYCSKPFYWGNFVFFFFF